MRVEYFSWQICELFHLILLLQSTSNRFQRMYTNTWDGMVLEDIGVKYLNELSLLGRGGIEFCNVGTL
jgi:hypothetical protein